MAAKAHFAEMLLRSIRVEGNVRRDLGDLSALVASIKAHGVLEPLIVTPDGRLLAGQRRLEAARQAGLERVPVRVLAIRGERDAVEIGLIENVQRADLDPLSRARAYHALVREHGATVEDVAALVGQGAGHVYQHLQLLALHPDVQQALAARAISFADARELAPLSAEDQAAVLGEIRRSPKPLSSRQVKALVSRRRALAAAKQQNSQPFDYAQDVPMEVGANAYDALFTAADNAAPPTDPATDALAALNAVIAEMVEAAQDEDQIRGWARRLSRILEQLGKGTS